MRPTAATARAHAQCMLVRSARTRTETQRNIQQRASDDLQDTRMEEIQVTYHLTSIYDHSIFEAFSKVIQKLIPQLPTLENLLNIFCAVRAAIRSGARITGQVGRGPPYPLDGMVGVRRGGAAGRLHGAQNSGIEKAFLFDVVSKIYIATDSSPVDMQTYELCSDMIDVVLDVSSIYGCGLGPCPGDRGCAD